MSSTLEEKKPSKSELELEWLAPVTDHIAYIVRIPANPDYEIRKAYEYNRSLAG